MISSVQRIWCPERTRGILKEINEIPINPARFVGKVYESEIGFDY